MQKFKETGDSSYINSKWAFNLTKYSDKVLRDRALNIAKNLKHDGYLRGFASKFYKFL